ncbi:putative pentatricopeptide repeat-containing protein At1g53330 [Impatiens glandulifera]|uniref:putative pentatricopeptide repeat-containing protein At1g53330 n=1 Tax=Impatiens glandulifera TaxID=253017 RepID=UPI001FB07E53|nr:putative pentatricopeptide repeat-containing protein At1g53330 [Impatiens glandulifera]
MGLLKVKGIIPISSFRLSSLLRLQKDPKIALQLFLYPNNEDDQQQSKPFRYTLRNYDLIINILGRAKMFDEMDHIVQRMHNETRFVPKEIIFCNIISFYGRASLPDQAIRVFLQIPSFHCHQTLRSVNTLLNALLDCRQFDQMMSLFLSMKELCEPDVCTYNIMMNAFSTCDDLDNAWKMFDEMKRNGIEPNVVTFATLINALCKMSCFEEAFKLKKEMVSVYRIQPNGYIYASLVKILCKMDKLSLAFKLKDEMLKSKNGVKSSVYTSLISSLYKVGRGKEVKFLLEEMKIYGCAPVTATYNSIIHGLCIEKDFKAAFAVIDDMENKFGRRADTVSYNTLICGLMKDGRWNEANDVFKDMPRKRCLPDIVTYRTLFSGFCAMMQLEEAALILDEMIFKGYKPYAPSVTKFIECLCDSGDVNLLGKVVEILAKGNVIDVLTWFAVVPIVCKNEKQLNSSSSNKLVDVLLTPRLEDYK